MSAGGGRASGGLGRYARVERERRFLLAAAPAGIEQAEAVQIEDRYLEGTRLRLRPMRGADGSVVRKLGQKELLADGSGARTAITTLYLSEAEHELLARLPAAHLAKRRHRVRVEGCLYAVDVFAGRLAGLVLAEAEYPDEERLAAARAPRSRSAR